MELRFRERIWCAMDVIVYFFVLVCQSVSSVCQVFCSGDRHVEACGLLEPYIHGVAAWWVSPYESLDNSLHMALTLCVEGVVVSFCCKCVCFEGEFVRPG